MIAEHAVVLAIDAGTGSARVIAYDSQGTQIAKAAREWTHYPTDGYQGGTTFDTRRGWDLVAAAARQVMDELQRLGKHVLAVTPSSMREGFVLYGSKGEEIFACPNTDGRARDEAVELYQSGDAAKIFATGGDWISITAPARLRWILKHEPDTFANARMFTMLSDWVVYRLTGTFSTDPTCGSSSALFDIRKRTWSHSLIEITGFATTIFPDVYECGSEVGRVTKSAAEDTGIPEGTVVTAGGADTQLALHGIGATPQVPTVVAGTFWQTTALSREPIIDGERRLRTLCYVDPDQWMIEGVGFLSGLAFRWFRDTFYGNSSIAYEDLDSMAAQAPPGCEGVIAIMSNVMQADNWAHAAPGFVGININRPMHPGHFARAIQEAAAYVVRGHLEILHALLGSNLSASQLILAGGSSAATEWPRILAAITASDIHRTLAPEATSYGAARIAFSSAGIEMPPAAGAPTVTRAEAEWIDAYGSLYKLWQGVYKAQVEATARSGILPLFDPPGATGKMRDT